MSVRTFLAVSAVIAALFGLGFILLPNGLASLYGVTLDPIGIYLAQLFGAALIGLAIINWSVRDAREMDGVLLGNLVANTIGFLITLFGQVGRTGGINAFGWITVALYLFLAVGYGYYRFTARGTLARATR
jgi:hypothetical protein